MQGPSVDLPTCPGLETRPRRRSRRQTRRKRIPAAPWDFARSATPGRSEQRPPPRSGDQRRARPSCPRTPSRRGSTPAAAPPSRSTRRATKLAAFLLICQRRQERIDSSAQPRNLEKEVSLPPRTLLSASSACATSCNTWKSGQLDVWAFIQETSQ